MEDKRYEDILEECRRTGELYEDPEFPPTDTAEGLQWKRPHEICQAPNFTVDGAKRNHFVQGDLENCWFASAIGSLTSAKPLLRSLCASEDQSQDQGFDKTNGQYCGAFRFRFWQYDSWEEVIVDDRLPVAMDGQRPAFLHSKDGGEFLGPLLEKAYAKLHGSYEALKAGHAAEALADLTAGWVDYVGVADAEDSAEVISRVRDALRRGSIVVASITEDSPSEPIQSRQMENGLTVNHGYVVIDYREVATNDGQETCLLHLRDPKAKRGWNGAWSRDSNDWDNLSDETKATLQGTTSETGEFWISSDDFLENITTVEICNGTDVAGNHGAAIARGEWKAGSSDDTFYEDPQFKVVIEGSEPEVTFTLELTQVGRRQSRRRNLPIKFRLFALEDRWQDTSLHLNRGQLDEMTSISARKMYADSRSFAEQFTISPGRFVVVASTERTDEPVQFALRLFCKSPGCSIVPAPS